MALPRKSSSAFLRQQQQYKAVALQSKPVPMMSLPVKNSGNHVIFCNHHYHRHSSHHHHAYVYKQDRQTNLAPQPLLTSNLHSPQQHLQLKQQSQQEQQQHPLTTITTKTSENLIQDIDSGLILNDTANYNNNDKSSGNVSDCHTSCNNTNSILGDIKSRSSASVDVVGKGTSSGRNDKDNCDIYEASLERETKNGKTIQESETETNQQPSAFAVGDKSFAAVVASSTVVADSATANHSKQADDDDDEDDFEDAIGSNSDSLHEDFLVDRDSTRCGSVIVLSGSDSAVTSESSENGEEDSKTEVFDLDSCKISISPTNVTKKHPPIVIKDIPVRFKKLLKAAAEKATAQRLRVEGIPLIRHYPQTTLTSAGPAGYLLPQAPLQPETPVLVPQYTPLVAASQQMFVPPPAYHTIQAPLDLSPSHQKSPNVTEAAVPVDSRGRTSVYNVGQTGDSSGCCFASSPNSQQDSRMVAAAPCVPCMPATPYGQMAYIFSPSQYHMVYSQDGNNNITSNSNIPNDTVCANSYYCGYNSSGLFVNQAPQHFQHQQQFYQPQQQVFSIQQLPTYQQQQYVPVQAAPIDATLAY